MSDIDIRDQLEAATRPAFTSPIDVEADLARGRRGRRRRRVRQVAAGTSACAVAGAAILVGLPLVGDEGGAPSGGRSVTVSTGSDPEAEDMRIVPELFHPAIREHLGRELTDHQSLGGDRQLVGWDGQVPLHDDDVSVATIRIRDDVRDGDEAVPLRCADDPAYDTCERRTSSDGTEIVIGRGEDDLLVAAWGRDGDLVEVTAHWAAGAEHNVTLDQLTGLATDDRLWIASDTVYAVQPGR